MQITSRIELHLSKHAAKSEYLNLKLYDSGAVFLDHHPVGASIEEAIDTLDTVMRELRVMEAARLASIKAGAKIPACTCAEQNENAKNAGEIFGCSRCTEMPHSSAVGEAGANPILAQMRR